MMQITRPVTMLFENYVPCPNDHLVERMIRSARSFAHGSVELDPDEFTAAHFGFAITHFFAVTLHSKGHAAYETPAARTIYRGDRILMNANQISGKRPATGNAEGLMVENACLQKELDAAPRSEADQVTAVSELMAQIFEISQQQLRQLEQIEAREDALALAAAREENLEKRLILAEREAITKQEEVFALTSALLDLQRDIEVTRRTADRVPIITQKLQSAENQIAELKASTSWRITRPLRKVKDWLKLRGRS